MWWRMSTCPRLLPLLAVVCTLAAPLPAQEMRAAWVASVFNLNFPSQPGLPAARQQAEIIAILETARAARLNALMIQVRPEGDALYRSALEPWSRSLTGVQGRDPGYDPLEVFLREGARRGIAIHAWINPYRAAANASQARAASHVSKRFPGHVHKVRSLLWCDPGSAEIQRHTLAVVADLVRRYPLAGLHLDDYFYPYPVDASKPETFPDGATYAAYRRGGGRLALADWRRENVNQLVKGIAGTVRRERPGCRFGISPFGIYTKGHPANVEVRLDQYHQLYADPVKWLREGWVDYLAPQLYWRNDSPQSFGKLLWWWRHPRTNPRRVPIYPGIAVDRLGGSHNWPLAEIELQLRLQRQVKPASGFILYNIKPLQQNAKNVRAAVTGG
jgi:uncharacterized lipoprotein YddW (UPF0748 family)